MKKKYPNAEGKGIIISTYWNDRDWRLLSDFMERQGIRETSTAIKQGFLFGANLIDTLTNGQYEIRIKPKKAPAK